MKPPSTTESLRYEFWWTVTKMHPIWIMNKASHPSTIGCLRGRYYEVLQRLQKPTVALTLTAEVLLCPPHLDPAAMRTPPTAQDPPSADDAIQPEFTNQLISNETS